MKELDLGKGKISKLIRKFAVPCIISLIIASLYNIVDQIFIGWSNAGSFGNAATNIVFPFTVIALAFALLIGDGSATLFNLSIGAKDKEKANKSIGNGLVLLILLSIFLTVFGLLFYKQILKVFGGNINEEICYNYAKEYLLIICLGLPFYIIGQGLNNLIRSDGSPKFAMFATILGAVSNIILDPIFIFVLKMDVKGAAIATVIGQVLSFAVTIIYLKKPKQFKITKDSIKFDKKICNRIFGLGASSFITQLTMVITIAVTNNLVSKYGYMTYSSTGVVFGSVIPLAVIGNCMKVFGIAISIVVGVGLGGMPIIGFNMGAGNTKRVKETIKYVLIINGIIGAIAFALFQLFPTQIINIFGNGNSPEYIEYAKYCFKIFLGGIILTCLIKSTSMVLQAMGSGLKSTILALLRDIIFSVPLFILIATISQNVVTMMWASVISDILGFIVSAILLKTEFVKLEKLDTISETIDENIEVGNPKLNKKIIITISREYGSGGHYVGQILAKELGVKFYDQEIINLTAKEYGYSINYIRKNEEQSSKPAYFYSLDDSLFESESKVIEKIAEEQSCVIVGRCANYVLRDRTDTINIFLYSDMPSKINRVVNYYGIKRENAENEIKRINNQRAKHYHHFTNRKWDSFENYDLSINVDKLGVEKTAQIIKNYINIFNIKSISNID